MLDIIQYSLSIKLTKVLSVEGFMTRLPGENGMRFASFSITALLYIEPSFKKRKLLVILLTIR